MKRKIVTDLKQLRKKCKQCPADMKWRIGIDLINSLEASVTPGVGLAAPQIGYPHRVILVMSGSEPVIMINPIVLRLFGGGGSAVEGCLSRPGAKVMVFRKKKIRVSYTDTEGELIVRTFRGFTARVVQHELDHLDGIVIGDKVKSAGDPK